MKRILLLVHLALLFMATMAIGCQSDATTKEEGPQPQVTAIAPFIEFEAGEYIIPYTVENPSDGESLKVEHSADWITNIDVDATTITLTVTANEGREPRVATLNLVYGKSMGKVVVEQSEKSRRSDLFPMYADADVPYRIPAIAVTKDGVLLCAADYRHSRTDIGVTHNGRIDLHINRSYDNGVTWQGVSTIVEGQGEASPDFMNVGFGDPCIVADRESNRVLMLSCAGNVSYQNGTRDNHQCIARFYSEDGGVSWSKPEDIAESIYSQFDDCTYGPVKAMFVASGKIHQSRFVKVGEYYRLYCAILLRNKLGTAMNYVLYSDDFGGSWSVLGNLNDPPVMKNADEPKVEELPDGSILISSRWSGGRYFNIYKFVDANAATGSWGTQTFSGATNNGVTARDNSTNGEVLLVKAVRVSDGCSVDVLLQSLPLGPERSNVGIYYKAFDDASDYSTVKSVAQNWEGVYQVTTLNSAYSTMTLQHDGRIAFLWEETTYCSGGGGYGGYTIAYDCYSLERLTNGKYRLAE